MTGMDWRAPDQDDLPPTEAPTPPPTVAPTAYSEPLAWRESLDDALLIARASRRLVLLVVVVHSIRVAVKAMQHHHHRSTRSISAIPPDCLPKKMLAPTLTTS